MFRPLRTQNRQFTTPLKNHTEISNGNIIHQNIIHCTQFLFSFYFYVLIVCNSYFLQKGDWGIARAYSTFLISHHTNPAYTLVYSNGYRHRYHIFANKDRAEKYDFNTEKHNSHTKIMILILEITLKCLKYCWEVRLMC